MNNNKSNKLVDNEKSDYNSKSNNIDIEELEIVKKNDYNSKTKNLSSLNTDKTMIKESFEKVFINNRNINSLMEKAYYSAQILLLLCFECDDADIVTHGKSLKFTTCIHK
ncbi:9258_t:CDS:2, partial [Cetraspora pellucida]